MKTIWRTALFVMLAGACLGQNREAEFSKLADRYYDELVFHFDPVQGTSAGFHQYDPLLPSGSRAEIDSQIAALKKWQGEIGRFDPRGLSAWAAADRELIASAIEGQLLSLDSIRGWEKNPDSYSSGVTNAIFVIMSRNYAPAAERLRSVIARERLIPRVFASARENLKDPPQIYTEIALEQLPGLVSFFEKDVPLAFQQVKDSQLVSEFQGSNQTVIRALGDYGTWLKNDLLPRSHGDFRIGAGNYRKKLLYDEMVDIPLDRLVAIGFEDLRRNQAEFRRVAAQIDAKRAPQQVLEEVERDHPSGDRLLQAFRDVLGSLRAFIEQHHIVTTPSLVLPILEESPPFMRALTTASMDTPGPYEKDQEAFFNVTLPDPRWPPKQKEEYLEDFNRGTIISTATHEAYPGHYVQFLWLQNVATKVRKLTACGSNAEGWAHYSEQMMLDEGYGGGDPKLRLGQLQDALLRNARYLAGIQMHTGKMTFAEAVDFFVKEAYQPRPIAEKEAKRGTSDPTYLVYTLGKLEILKLREDYRKLKGPQYSLGEFHDAFMKQGGPPIKIVRRALLGNDSPVL
jgi:uncharacterized protein (DUF885 family)